MFNQELPRLENGEIDYDKVDMRVQHHLLPKLFSTVADIEKFIEEWNVDVPVLKNLLKLRKEDKLELTPTENIFYFDNMFEYIYDVYRVPVPKTFEDTGKWLEYIESCLVWSGLGWVKNICYGEGSKSYYRWVDLYNMHKRLNAEYGRRDTYPDINCYRDIEDVYYKSLVDGDEIDTFMIRTDRFGIQPLCIGDEAYALVLVEENRVYITGYDDSSYTLETDSAEKSKLFATYLKTGAPVWNFTCPKLIHPDLEFTN